jgi:hypothetical protein
MPLLAPVPQPAALASLTAALTGLLEKSEGATVAVASLRHKLKLLGLTPDERTLTLLLVSRFEAEPDRPRVNGRRPRVWLGVAFRAGSLATLASLTQQSWEDRLKSEGLGMDPGPDPARRSEFTSSLEIASSDAAKATALANKVKNLHVRKEIAEAYHSCMSEWLWRGCPWRGFKPIEREILSRRLETGEAFAELAAHFELEVGVVKRALTKHHALAGWDGRNGR